MKHIRINAIALIFLFVLTLSLGCKRSSAPPTPLTLEELPGVLEKAFSKANPQATELAAQVVASLKVQDYSKAFLAIQNLAGLPGLNKEQVNVTARGNLTIMTLLQSAQAQGDPKAAQTMKRYMETK